jgi:hypothetical protein
MNAIEGATADRQRSVIACIAASTCDELRVGGHCVEFFGER